MGRPASNLTETRFKRSVIFQAESGLGDHNFKTNWMASRSNFLSFAFNKCLNVGYTLGSSLSLTCRFVDFQNLFSILTRSPN